ncbi:MAG: hypothetical protein IPL31_13400 [Saprospiraceae bacterium]|nr:hypothetical protein [Saprospiraceae bacterium]
MVPVRGRQCSSEQVPEIAKKFPDYNSFANANLNDIYGEQIKNALHYEAKLFESVIIKNNKSHFEIIPLPMEAQFSTIQGIVCYDFDNDQKNDIVIVGNQFGSEIETTRADASVGLFLKGTKDPFNYKPLSVQESGIFLPDDVKDLKAIQVSNNKHLLVGSNNSALLFLKNQLILRQNPKK